MLHTNFVHLHVHSHYSILDGAASIKAIVETARRFRMPALAITDHGNMFGAIDFYQTALKRGIKPIFGFEAYMASSSRLDRVRREESPNYHLVLLAKNLTGYKNLVKLSTLAYTEGFYYRPRIDWELLEKYHEGLIGLSACIQGEIPYKLLKGDTEAAYAAARRYRDVFGADSFYVEIQNHGLSDQIKVLPMLVDLAKNLEIPLVATNDSHYVEPEDWEAHEAILCLQTQAVLSDEKRFTFGAREFYFKSPQLMGEIFREFPEALTNTLRVAEKCNVQLLLGKSILPHFPIPDGKTSESYLMELCNAALPRRYPEAAENVLKRLEFELSVIKKMGFCDYFLIVWDFIREARAIGVPVGPGRGSAAGSIVAYLLGITNIDPLKYGLLFERFLNPDRISMPDIDIDFSDEGRGRVIEYVIKKYGKERVSQIVTFNQILAKLAIRDIGRVMEIPLAEVDRMAKLVPDGPGVHLKKVLHDVPELKKLVDSGDAKQKKLFRIASTVDGLVRHTGIHAAGVVISRDPLMDIVPLYRDRSEEIVTQYEKNAIEKIGLLKMDFLGLKTLSIIKNAIEAIKESRGIDVDVDQFKLDDPMTFDLLCKGLTLGVFQLESEGMRSLITRLKPTVFEDIIALLAMYRPGPLGSGMVDDFVDRKHERKKVAYPHPDLEPILKETYGVFLYQEQCMFTANILANFTMGQADQLRKAMAKKNPEDMEKMGKLFVEGAVKRKIPREQAQGIFDLMASFGEYGFNKSHSAAYALVTFQTAYLKAHYQVEFVAAILSSELNDTDKISNYIVECRNLGIQVLKPEINHSRKLFAVEGGKIRYGLAAIKGVGESAVESILEAVKTGGPFKSLTDLTKRVDTRLVNNRVLDALIKAGACDCFGLNRRQMLEMTGDALKSGQQSQKEKLAGQFTFADLLGETSSEFGGLDLVAPKVVEMNERELLTAEKEAFGFYFSGNPFGVVAPLGKVFSTHSLKNIGKAGDGNIVRTAGLLTGLKKHTTKKGDIMAFATIEAENDVLDISIFPQTYAASSGKLIIDEPLFLVVRGETLAETLRVNAEMILTQEDLNAEGVSQVKLVIPPEKATKEEYEKLLRLVRRYPGVCPFTITIQIGPAEKVTLKPPAGLKVALLAGFIKEWEEACGKDSVVALFPGIKVENGRNRSFRRPGNGG